ncbi:MAG: hypothetical protein OXR66_08905 [Candidatus Woesearchaeota archaeon]|nr:hypothetical protein [Candidatus Woesearchaeota archaeon]
MQKHGNFSRVAAASLIAMGFTTPAAGQDSVELPPGGFVSAYLQDVSFRGGTPESIAEGHLDAIQYGQVRIRFGKEAGFTLSFPGPLKEFHYGVMPDGTPGIAISVQEPTPQHREWRKELMELVYDRNEDGQITPGERHTGNADASRLLAARLGNPEVGHARAMGGYKNPRAFRKAWKRHMANKRERVRDLKGPFGYH